MIRIAARTSHSIVTVLAALLRRVWTSCQSQVDSQNQQHIAFAIVNFVRAHAIILYSAPLGFSPLLSANGGYQTAMSGKREDATQEAGACGRGGDREEMARGVGGGGRKKSAEVR